VVLYLDVDSIEDLKRRLREVGYSDKAVEEILKWYRQDNP
jgi:DNA-binding transcriptional MerR regulator